MTESTWKDYGNFSEIVDMSPEAVGQRIRDVAQLYALQKNFVEKAVFVDTDHSNHADIIAEPETHYGSENQ